MHLSETEGPYQKMFYNLEYPDSLKVHFRVWSKIFLKTLF